MKPPGPGPWISKENFREPLKINLSSAEQLYQRLSIKVGRLEPLSDDEEHDLSEQIAQLEELAKTAKEIGLSENDRAHLQAVIGQLSELVPDLEMVE
jgi:hypothetical protein